MSKTKFILYVALFTMLLVSACSVQAPQVTSTPAAQQIGEPEFTPVGVPLTDADVPRVSIEEAKAALESGAAVIVDVRSPDAFASSHVAGAINVPLIDIEMNLASVPLEKEQWIITYCT
jgi:3-mercaptopyruvate sulfurtransferase SseA